MAYLNIAKRQLTQNGENKEKKKELYKEKLAIKIELSKKIGMNDSLTNFNSQKCLK